MLIFVIGPSASGKGTQADLLSERYKIPHLSTGQLLRKEVANKTDIGKQLEPIIDSGEFAPIELNFMVLEPVLKESIEKYGGAIIDGYPRLFAQIPEIDPIINDQMKISWVKVVHYLLSFEDAQKRLLNREETGGGRADDNTLKRRFDQYDDEIKNITDYYRNKGILIEIDASPSIDDVFKETINKLEENE